MINTTINSLTKYTGLCSISHNKDCTFKLFHISRLLNLETQCKNIKDIIQVTCTINIIDYKFVKTPKGTSYEGHILTGNKIFIKGIIKCNIQYNEYDDLNKLFSLNKNILFFDSVQLPENYYFNSNTISISPNIIDICANKIDKNSIFITILSYIGLNY